MLAGHAAASGADKDGKASQIRRLAQRSHNAPLIQTRKAAQGFCFTIGSEFKRAETKLREKHAAESGWKQDVSNRPLSRSDLAGVPTERSVFRVSFVRAAYGATGVKQNPGESFSAPGDSA
ncbi:hypothetical protein DesLBE_0564 [Desulfitobacterium sp. LBE]|uniref:Uncharacterized protein n=1 Tax=Desulfitobacterium hafniense (strain Y51) TaxID=138119 RepID=Q24X07_DESHY|nr:MULTISPECIES: hypothetical protein [Desulfitobacterium]TWH56361.1 hypothetical protein DesLBE_0564 [Desulfitobacterium sp. LBE]BAE83435.1 hypothetical protein DSY1646 [Desulfitobacterium hafniense Y51]